MNLRQQFKNKFRLWFINQKWNLDLQVEGFRTEVGYLGKHATRLQYDSNLKQNFSPSWLITFWAVKDSTHLPEDVGSVVQFALKLTFCSKLGSIPMVR